MRVSSCCETKALPQPQSAGPPIKNDIIRRYWTETHYRTNRHGCSVRLFSDSKPVIQTENNQGTYFSLSPRVEAVGVGVLVYWTWGYWWDWSGLIHYEDAPYMTKSSGQWGEKQIRTRSGGGCRAWPCPTHITV